MCWQDPKFLDIILSIKMKQAMYVFDWVHSKRRFSGLYIQSRQYSEVQIPVHTWLSNPKWTVLEEDNCCQSITSTYMNSWSSHNTQRVTYSHTHGQIHTRMHSHTNNSICTLCRSKTKNALFLLKIPYSVFLHRFLLYFNKQ